MAAVNLTKEGCQLSSLVSPFAGAAPLICFPVKAVFPKRPAEAVVIVKDEFQQEFPIPDNVTVPSGSRIECKVVGKPRAAFAERTEGLQGSKQAVRLVVVVQAIVRFVVRNPAGRIIAIFFGAFERRIEAVVKLPVGAELVLKDVLIDCGPCRRRMDKIVCDIRIRVIFKVVGSAGIDP